MSVQCLFNRLSVLCCFVLIGGNTLAQSAEDAWAVQLPTGLHQGRWGQCLLIDLSADTPKGCQWSRQWPSVFGPSMFWEVLPVPAEAIPPSIDAFDWRAAQTPHFGLQLSTRPIRPDLRDDPVEPGASDMGVRYASDTANVAELDRMPWSDRVQRTGLSLVAEASRLIQAGQDIYARTLLLAPGARNAWITMRAAARADGIELQAISGYRSRAYQAGILRRKLAAGQSLQHILTINAAPGYSEHHSGNAIDIGVAGQPPAEESFESTAAFRWLTEHAGKFGFRMSYPRGNSAGFQYEPWHWCWSDGRLIPDSKTVQATSTLEPLPVSGQEQSL